MQFRPRISTCSKVAIARYNMSSLGRMASPRKPTRVSLSTQKTSGIHQTRRICFLSKTPQRTASILLKSLGEPTTKGATGLRIQEKMTTLRWHRLSQSIGSATIACCRLLKRQKTAAWKKTTRLSKLITDTQIVVRTISDRCSRKLTWIRRHPRIN